MGEMWAREITRMTAERTRRGQPFGKGMARYCGIAGMWSLRKE